MSSILWIVALADAVGTAVALTTLARQLRASPNAVPRVDIPRIGQAWTEAASLRRRTGAAPCIVVLGRRRCVGTFRILPYIARLGADCHVETLVRFLDEPGARSPKEPPERGVAVLPDGAFRWRAVPSPLACYVDATGLVRQVSRVDTLLALAHFAEGCPDPVLRQWPWTVHEWADRYATAQRTAQQHLAAAAAPAERPV